MTTEGSTPAQATEGASDLIFEGRVSVVALVGPTLSSMFWLIVSIVLFFAGPLGERIGKNTEVRGWSTTLRNQIAHISESLKPLVNKIGTMSTNLHEEPTSGTPSGSHQADKKPDKIEPSAIAPSRFTPSGILILGFNILGCVFLFAALKRIFKAVWHWLSTRYRLTTHRIEIEQGIFSKCIQNFELWRVQDINYTRSFWEFVFHLGRIHVKALDAGSEDVFLIGPIPDARKVYDRLKDARLAAGQRAGAQAMGVVG